MISEQLFSFFTCKMSSQHPTRIKLVGFQDHQAAIMAVRQAVFVDELGIDPQLEWDQKDEQARYAIAIHSDRIVGIGRILKDGQLGRIAVLPEWRRQGIASAIIQCLIEAAQVENIDVVHLSAQLDSVPLYEKFGFVRYGDTFIAAGIVHQGMSLDLSTLANNLIRQP